MLDINQLVNDKLAQMETDQVIETAINNGIEKVVLGAVTDALAGYQVRATVSRKIEKEVDTAINNIDFSACMMQVLTDTMQEHIQNRLEGEIKKIFLCERKELKLSEIFTAYRRMLSREIDGLAQYECGQFLIDVKEELAHWLTVRMHPEREEMRLYTYPEDTDIYFHILYGLDGRNPKQGRLSGLHIRGTKLEEKMKLGRLNDVELMLVQAAYNDIPVIVDIEDYKTIDTSYDTSI